MAFSTRLASCVSYPLFSGSAREKQVLKKMNSIKPLFPPTHTRMCLTISCTVVSLPQRECIQTCTRSIARQASLCCINIIMNQVGDFSLFLVKKNKRKNHPPQNKKNHTSHWCLHIKCCDPETVSNIGSTTPLKEREYSASRFGAAQKCHCLVGGAFLSAHDCFPF